MDLPGQQHLSPGKVLAAFEMIRRFCQESGLSDPVHGALLHTEAFHKIQLTISEVDCTLVTSQKYEKTHKKTRR